MSAHAQARHQASTSFRATLTGPGHEALTRIDNATALRAALAVRSSERVTPPFLSEAAALVGAMGTDEFLCQLGRSIAASLRSVPASAEVARSQLRSMRATLHAAVDARCDDLEAGVMRAEAAKIAALERELTTVDAALERWRYEARVVSDAVLELSDAELLARHADLVARLDALEALMRALPTGPVEPPHVGLAMDASAPVNSIAEFGRVVAPRAIKAEDVILEGTPNRVRPGDTLQLRVILSSRHTDQSTEELMISLGALAASLRFDSSVCAAGEDSRGSLIPCVLTPSPANRCVMVTIKVPPATPRNSYLSVQAFYFARLSISPIIVPIHVGLLSPMLLKGACSYDPCISSEGRLYLPVGETVIVLDADGSELPSISPASVGLPTIYGSALSCGVIPQLLLHDSITLVAVDPTTRAVHWRRKCDSVSGIAPLPKQGVVAVAPAKGIYTFRLCDGALIGRVSTDTVYCYASADSDSGLVFASLYNPPYALHAWSWSPSSSNGGATGGSLVPLGRVTAAGEAMQACILAVMPPAPGKRTSHLIVGTLNDKELRVLSLPRLAHVHTHRMESICLVGLAADPCGMDLAVCDAASQSTHVIAWPLNGMPHLD